jgi:hypothetical protein
MVRAGAGAAGPGWGSRGLGAKGSWRDRRTTRRRPLILSFMPGICRLLTRLLCACFLIVFQASAET